MNGNRSKIGGFVKKILIPVVIFILLVIGIHALLTRNNKPTPTAQPAVTYVKITPSGIAYPSTWQEAQTISQDSKLAGVISAARRTNPAITVSVRKVDGALAADFDIQKLPDQVVTSLKNSLDGFSLQHKSVVKIGNQNAAELTYSVDGTDGTNTMFIIPLATKTYYITYISKTDLSKLSADINKINLSVAKL